jgi:hypothetical protein
LVKGKTSSKEVENHEETLDSRFSIGGIVSGYRDGFSALAFRILCTPSAISRCAFSSCLLLPLDITRRLIVITTFTELGFRALGLEVDKLWLAEDLVPRQLTLWSVTLQQ